MPVDYRCDDCFDGSDEKDCFLIEKQLPPTAPTRSVGNCTTESDFQCTVGMTLRDTEETADHYEERRKGCLLIDKKCNHHIDCADGSDEAGCRMQPRLPGNCTRDTDFQCTSSMAIDGINDGDYNFEEHRKGCVRRWKICDGTKHCQDNSDEMDCPELVTQRPGNSPGCINKRNFQCKTGFTTVHIRDGDDFAEEYERGCLPRSFRCDGHRDCEDYSDEKDCPICDSTCDCDCMRLMNKLFV